MKGLYKHYKGAMYEVIDVALHTETQAKLVLYHALYDCPQLTAEYGDKPIFARPYNMFFETVKYQGRIVPRFTKVDS